MKKLEDFTAEVLARAEEWFEGADPKQLALWRAAKAEALRRFHAEIIVEGEDPSIRRWKEDPFPLRGM